jgi:hypothetical protein
MAFFVAMLTAAVTTAGAITAGVRRRVTALATLLNSVMATVVSGTIFFGPHRHLTEQP